MAMAFHAPYDSYKKHFGVTDTAVTVLRELVPDLTRTIYRTDEDLANVIDEWAWDSFQSGKMEKILDEGRPTILIDMRARREDLWALVRDNNTPHKGGPQKTIITVLNTKMVEQNKHSGRWTEHGTSPGKPMVSMQAQLAGKVIDIIRTAAPPARKAAPAPSPDVHKVVWVDEEDKQREQEVLTRQAATDLVLKLVEEDEVHPLDIQVFRLVMKPSWEEVKRKVQVALE